MATIGLKDIYIADITEDANGHETYGIPEYLAPAISVDFDINRSVSKLPADDKIFDQNDEFIDGTISVNVAELPSIKAAKLTGATIDSNGLLIDTAEDSAPYKAFGFRAKTSKGTYRYIWLYRVKFAPAKETFNTKGESISYNTPTIAGTILQRNKPDSKGNHPWRASVTEGESAASASAISTWFTAVPPEPSYPAAANGGE